ncbi:hypothetical protein D1871_00455 [Nakamurella silvestris]|nr:hypothetical protein D1871_00455 [Nakamurella silvestris]
MTSTSAKQLLDALGPMSYLDRQRRVREVALAATPDDTLDLLLTELDRSGPWAQGIAQDIAVITGWRPYLLHRMRSTDTRAALRAWAELVRIGAVDDILLGEQLPDLPREWRALTYRVLRRGGRQDSAEFLLPVVHTRFGAQEAAALLAPCSADTVRAWLPRLAHALAGQGGLARRHPEVVLEHLRAVLDSTPRGSWDSVWATWIPAHLAFAEGAPAAFLGLLEHGEGDLPVGSDQALTVLARHDPGRVARLLLHPRSVGRPPAGRKLWRALRPLPDGTLVELAHRVGEPGLRSLLRALPAPRRSRVFHAFLGERDLDQAGLSTAVLDLLTPAGRGVQANRLLGLRSGTDDPRTTLELTARLPWAEARVRLQECTTRPLVADRATGYRLLIGAAAGTGEPTAFEEMLRSLTRLRNEQDLVRQQVVLALAAVPPGLFGSGAAPLLEQLVTHTLLARDCSWATRRDVQTLLGRMLVQSALAGQPDLTATVIRLWELLGAGYRTITFPDLLRTLPAGGESTLFDALAGRVALDARRGLFGIALDLAAALGRRAWKLVGLQEALEAACSASDDNVVEQAVRWWLADPHTRADRVERVLRQDSSTITVERVLAAVGTQRTDLLGLVLDQPPSGRFLSAQARFVPIFGRSVRRWTPAQQAQYRGLLTDLTRLPAVTTWERIRAIHQLAHLTDVLDTLVPLAHDQDIPIAEAALAALSRTDSPAAALPTLLAEAQGDRARVAVYAATRAARFLAPGMLTAAFEPLLGGTKITARKEAVRILAENGVPDCAAVLERIWMTPGQHRDVRRAVVSAGRWCLEDERVWGLLQQAAQDPAVTTALLEYQPRRLAAAHRSRFAGLIGTVARSADLSTRLAALSALGRWGNWDDGANSQLLQARVMDLDDTATWGVAAQALVSVSAATDTTEPIGRVVDLLSGASGPVEPTQERDQPARQRLIRVVEILEGRASRNRALGPGSRKVAERLAADDTLRLAAVELACAVIDWPAPAEELTAQLLELGALAADPAAIAVAAGLLGNTLSAVVGRGIEPGLAVVAEELAVADHRGAGRFALTIVGVAGDNLGWTAPWVGRLVRLRRHPDPQTRVAALNTFVRSE